MASRTITPKRSYLKAGQKFGRLTAVTFVGRDIHHTPIWLWKCDCGKQHKATSDNITKGKTKSCGCLRNERTISRNKDRAIHGMSHTTPHIIWWAMIQRCYNENHEAYRNYGGRGIVVCDRWKESFLSFYADMWPRTSPVHTLDRIDNDGPYCKENCKWSTLSEQARNRRFNRFVLFEGRSITTAEAASIYGMEANTLRRRLNKGWNVHTAITTKVRYRTPKKRAPPRAPGTDPAS